MCEPLAKEYPYPPNPTSHGLQDEDSEYWDDEEAGAYGPFEIRSKWDYLFALNNNL